MPTTMMVGLHTYDLTFSDNAATIASPFNPYLALGSAISNTCRNGKPQGGFRYAPSGMPTFTTDYVATMRQKMDESNHEIVNMLTQQIGTMLNPLIQNTIQSYQQLAHQVGRSADFLGLPQCQLCLHLLTKFY